MTATPRLIALNDILARVEKATGEDEEIDALALCAVAYPSGFVMQSRINGAWCIYEEKLNKGSPRLWDRGGGWHRVGGWPLTSSLDACLSLAERVLPKNHDWQLCKGGGCTIIYGNTPDGFDILDTGVQSAPTPALGFLTAILTALIAVEEKGSGK